MRRKNYNPQKKESGFTLIEILVGIFILMLIASLAFMTLRPAVKDRPRAVLNLKRIISQRQSAALKLIGATRRSAAAPAPLGIDMTSDTDRCELVIDGIDLDKNGIDDEKGTLLTFWNGSVWKLAYRQGTGSFGDFEIVSAAANLGSVPQIGESQLTAQINFDGNGRPTALPAGKSLWAIYAVPTNGDTLPMAVTISQSGAIESWSWDGGLNRWASRDRES